MNFELDEEDFGTLCICAIRYCQGRETYMPSLVQSIVKPFLPMLSDKDIGVMAEDCDRQRRFDLYGDMIVDKPGWIAWENAVLAEEKKRREKPRPTMYQIAMDSFKDIGTNANEPNKR